jgi:hypothetical protein
MPGNFETQASMFYSYVFDLGDDYVIREQKYTNCWNFYEGKHWDKKAPEGFDQIVVNYCKVFSKKMRRFTFRNDWTLAFNEEQKGKKIDEWTIDAWRDNDLHELTNKCADFASIFGDFYIYVKWIPMTDTEDGRIKLTALDPRTVFPFYNGLTGEMEQCIILFPYRETRVVEGRLESVVKWYREVHSKDNIYIHSAEEKSEFVAEDVQPNPIGKILIVHGINQPVAGSFHGCSDIEDIIEPQKLMDEKVSDISDILDYHASPVTVIKGAKARQLEKGPNKVWSGLPANADVFNLSSAGNIAEAMQFIDFIKKTMHEISNVTEESLAGGKKMSNTSAVALSLDFEPMIELAEDKRFYFAKAIKKTNELIIDIGVNKNKISKEGLKDSDLYHSDVTFGSLLPRDRQSDLKDIQVEMSLNLETPQGALERLGEHNPEKKLAELEEFKKQKIEEQRLTALNTAAAANANTPPPNDNKSTGAPGDKGSQQAAKAVNDTPKSHGEQVVAAQVKKRTTS